MNNTLKKELIDLFNKDQFNDIDDLVPSFISTKIVRKNNKTWEKVLTDKDNKFKKPKHINKDIDEE